MSAITTIRPALVGKLNERQVLRVLQIARAAVACGSRPRERPERADRVEGGRVAAEGGVARRSRRDRTRARPTGTEAAARHDVGAGARRRDRRGALRGRFRGSRRRTSRRHARSADARDVPGVAHRARTRRPQGDGEAGRANARPGRESAGAGRLPQGMRRAFAQRPRRPTATARPSIWRSGSASNARCFRNRTRCASRSGTTVWRRGWTTSRSWMLARASDWGS